MASQVKVVVRVRPLLPSENGHSTKLLKVVDGGVLLQSQRPEDTMARQFPFQGIFDGSAEQVGREQWCVWGVQVFVCNLPLCISTGGLGKHPAA